MYTHAHILIEAILSGKLNGCFCALLACVASVVVNTLNKESTYSRWLCTIYKGITLCHSVI